MKLRTLHIQNFRALKDVSTDFDRFTCLIGANGVGKSCVFAALNVLFRKAPSKDPASAALRKDDFHNRDVAAPISITATFDELSPTAAEDLKHYVRQGKLILKVHAEWNEETQTTLVRQVGRRMVMPEFKPFFAKHADGEGIKELRTVYNSLREKYPTLPAITAKAEMYDALREYEEAHPDLGKETESRDDFYGATGSSSVLAKHLVWIHVPAVKDAADEQVARKGSWLGQLVQQVVRSKIDFDSKLASIRTAAAAAYREVVDEQQSQLTQLSSSLTERMREWAHPDAALNVRWSDDGEAAISVSEPNAEVEAADGNFDGPLSRHGHGFQRSYLVSLLQELSESNTAGAPTMLLGIEEPELYQHPPQARHLANVLERFSAKRGQVVVCTHSPYFVSGHGFPNVRLLRRAFSAGARRTELSHASLATVEAELKKAGRQASRSVGGTRIKLHQQLHPVANELFFAPVIVLVEGGEDLAYLTAQLHLSGLDDEFRRLGCHIIPADRKSNIPFLLAVAVSLRIPTFTVFDADTNLCEVPPGADEKAKQNAASRRGQHEADNSALLKLAGHPNEPALPADDLWKPNLVTWRTNLTSVFETEIGLSVVEAARATVRKVDGLTEKDLDKSLLFVGAVVEELWTSGKKSASLGRLCDAILAFARAATGRLTPATPGPPAVPGAAAPASAT